MIGDGGIMELVTSKRELFGKWWSQEMKDETKADGAMQKFTCLKLH
jgi:hypothetical protein